MLAVRLSWQHEYIFITEIDDASMLIYFNFALMAFQDASELYLLYTLDAYRRLLGLLLMI